MSAIAAFNTFLAFVALLLALVPLVSTLAFAAPLLLALRALDQYTSVTYAAPATEERTGSDCNAPSVIELCKVLVAALHRSRVTHAEVTAPRQNDMSRADSVSLKVNWMLLLPTMRTLIQLQDCDKQKPNTSLAAELTEFAAEAAAAVRERNEYILASIASIDNVVKNNVDHEIGLASASSANTASNDLSNDNTCNPIALSMPHAIGSAPIFGDKSASSSFQDLGHLDDEDDEDALLRNVPTASAIPMDVPMLIISSPSDGYLYVKGPEEDHNLLAGRPYVLDIKMRVAWRSGRKRYQEKAFPRYATLADIQPWVKHIAGWRKTELSHGRHGAYQVQTEEQFQQWKQLQFSSGKKVTLRLKELYILWDAWKHRL